MKDLLNQIEELKTLSEKIYTSSGNLRDQADNNLKEACNTMRHFSGKLSEVIDLANDIVIFTNRSDTANLEKTMQKLNRYLED